MRVCVCVESGRSKRKRSLQASSGSGSIPVFVFYFWLFEGGGRLVKHEQAHVYLFLIISLLFSPAPSLQDTEPPPGLISTAFSLGGVDSVAHNRPFWLGSF